MNKNHLKISAKFTLDIESDLVNKLQKYITQEIDQSIIDALWNMPTPSPFARAAKDHKL